MLKWLVFKTYATKKIISPTQTNAKLKQVNKLNQTTQTKKNLKGKIVKLPWNLKKIEAWKNLKVQNL